MGGGEEGGGKVQEAPEFQANILKNKSPVTFTTQAAEGVGAWISQIAQLQYTVLSHAQTLQVITIQNTHTRLTALFPGLPG